MKLTNRLNLPEPIVAALRDDDYSKGDAWRSVTQLIDSPRKVLLYERHQDELEEDVSDRLWLLMGKAIHQILENPEPTQLSLDFGGGNELREKRFHAEVLGQKISGALDYLDLRNERLTDYKVTSVFTVKKGGQESWPAQLNLYRLLAEDHGYRVSHLDIAVVCRDWRPGEAKRDPQYPQQPFVLLPMPVWDLEQTRAYLRDRVRLHLAAEASLPYCTPEERWKKPDQWALMKLGRKTAVFLYDKPGNAGDAARVATNHYVEYRPGEPTRCMSYCAARDICMKLKDGQWTKEEEGAYGQLSAA